MNKCSRNCTLCNRIIISTAVTVVTVDGVDTLVIDLPAPAVGTVPYLNNCKYCIVIAQAIPIDTVTVAMPVAFSIGGDTTTVYPFLNCDCSQVTACAIQAHKKYPVCVSTSAVGGVFKTLRKLNCYPNAVLASLPAPAPADGGGAAVANVPAANPTVMTVRTTRNNVKEVKASE